MNLNLRKMITLFSLLAVLIPSQCLSFLEEDEEVIKFCMPGAIRHIAVVPGQQVKREDLLCIIDVMKMYHHIRAPRDGFIGSLYLTVDQRIEENVPLITILPFMPVGKEGDPMDVDESPLPTFQSEEPSIEDSSQNGLGEFVSLAASVIASEAKQSIPDHQPSQQVSTSPWFAVDSSSPRNDEVKEDAVASLPFVIAKVEKPSNSEVENEPKIPQQEEILPLVVASIIETFDNEGEGPDIFTPTGVVASEANHSIPEHRSFQKVLTLSWVAAGSMSPRNDEVEKSRVGSSSIGVIIASEAKQSILGYQLPSWLTGLLLLGFLFFRRSKLIRPYHVKNVLILKTAENLDIPGYLRDAA